MKKGLIVLLIFILVVCAFFVGTNINLKRENDLTTTVSEENEKVDIYVNDTTEEMITDKTTTKASTTEEETYIEYEPEGFAKIGKNFDTLLKIIDWHVGVPGESRSHVVIKNNQEQGYYLESSYATGLDTWSNQEIYEIYKYYNLDFITLASTKSEDLIPFYFYDDYTLVLGESDNETRIIVEEVIDVNENGSIIRTKIDRYGFDNDEYDVYFFVTNLEKILSFETSETGEDKYLYERYDGLSERMIYFE